MNKNYYEILEVDKKASPEIIKKAYNTLAKKYHPDLQSGERKIEYGEKLKLINSAYETLSDASKRKDYDNILQNQLNEKSSDFDTLALQNASLTAQIEHLSKENLLLKHRLKEFGINLNNIDYSNFANSRNTQNLNNQVNSSQKNSQTYNSNYSNDPLMQTFKRIISLFIALIFFVIMIKLFL